MKPINRRTLLLMLLAPVLPRPRVPYREWVESGEVLIPINDVTFYTVSGLPLRDQLLVTLNEDLAVMCGNVMTYPTPLVDESYAHQSSRVFRVLEGVK